MSCRATLLTLLLAATMVVNAAPASRTLGAAEAARLALDNGIAVLSSGLDLKLQSQQLEAVSRGEFRPKATLNINGQRSTSRLEGAPGSTANQMSSSLATTWKLHSGAQLSLQAIDSAAPGLKGRSLSVGITQPLWRGFGATVATASLRSAESSLEIARIGFEQTGVEVVSTTLEAYFSRNLALLRAGVAHEGLVTAQRMDEVSHALVDAGRSPASVLLQSEAEVAQARFAAAQAEQDEIAARRALLVAIGEESSVMDVQIDMPDLAEQYVNLPIPSLHEATQLALAAHPAIRTARENLRIAHLELLKAEDQLKLPLDLTVSATRLPPALGQTGLTSSAVGLSTEIVFDRAPLRLARSSAQVGVRKAQMQLAETERTIRHGMGDALRAHDFALQQLALARRGADIGRRRLEMELDKQRLGRSSVLELSAARREAVEAENQMAQANHQVLLAKIAVWKATGTLLKQWGLANRVEEWSRELIR